MQVTKSESTTVRLNATDVRNALHDYIVKIFPSVETAGAVGQIDVYGDRDRATMAVLHHVEAIQVRYVVPVRTIGVEP
jgi:hypothetical protein